MAAPSLKRRRKNKFLITFRHICVSIGIMVAFPPIALAALDVIDKSHIAKAIDQIKWLKKQFEVAEETRDKVQETVNAIGEAGSFSVPFISLSRLQGTLATDANCLLPDFSKLFPDIDFDDLGTSICERKYGYAKALLPVPEDFEGITSREELDRKLDEIQERRIDTLATASLDGLAQADRALKSSEQTGQAVADLRSKAASAEDVNQRLDVLTNAQMMTIQTQNQTNQLIAQQLKVQSAVALALGVPLSETTQGEQEEEENQ